MLNEQWGFVRKVLCDPKKQPALPVSTLRPGSYTLIQARIIIQSGVMMIIVWRLWWKINLLRLANAIKETIWCEEWSAMAPVELRCLLLPNFLSFCHLGVFFFTFGLTIFISSLFPLFPHHRHAHDKMWRFYKWRPFRDQRLTKGRCCSR